MQRGGRGPGGPPPPERRGAAAGSNNAKRTIKEGYLFQENTGAAVTDDGHVLELHGLSFHGRCAATVVVAVALVVVGWWWWW